MVHRIDLRFLHRQVEDKTRSTTIPGQTATGGSLQTTGVVVISTNYISQPLTIALFGRTDFVDATVGRNAWHACLNGRISAR